MKGINSGTFILSPYYVQRKEYTEIRSYGIYDLIFCDVFKSIYLE
jgi:hypothetical protein